MRILAITRQPTKNAHGPKNQDSFQDVRFGPKNVLPSRHDALVMPLHATGDTLPQAKAEVTKTFS